MLQSQQHGASSPHVGRSTYVRRKGAVHTAGRAAVELALIGVLYVGYSASRLLASTDFAPARGRALDILSFEQTWRLDVESWLNGLFQQHDWLGVSGSFWYATTHYIVTAAVLIWIYHRSAARYVTARRALVLAALIGLAFYLVMPTAPPRLVQGGYADILSLHSDVGWWGADASAPKGLGQITNDLAAFPSLHAGWAWWVAIVLMLSGVQRIVQIAGHCYALITMIVIIGTGNHWVVDAVVGWLVILVAFGLVAAWERCGTPVDDGGTEAAGSQVFGA